MSDLVNDLGSELQRTLRGKAIPTLPAETTALAPF